MSKSGIYKITNKVNGKIYIGLSNNIDRRFQEHVTPRNVKYKTTNLAKAFRKYGIDSFVFEIIELCEVDFLAEREMYHISIINPEYNMNEGGIGNKGLSLTDAQRLHLSVKNKEVWNAKPPEEKQMIINRLTRPKIGHLVSEKTRQKLSYINLGKKLPIESLIKRTRTDKVISMMILGVSVAEFGDIKMAAEAMYVTPQAINNVLKGKCLTAGGFHWKYVTT